MSCTVFKCKFCLITKNSQLLINILKTDRAYEKSKQRLYLHDIGFQGLLCLMQGQPSSLEMTHLLTDIILSRGCYFLILSR